MTDKDFAPHDLGIELLRTFVAVVETRNFTKAAVSLSISQPTVSGHVKRLQDHLGAAVFDKSAPGVMLTRQGEVVLAYARQILAANDELLDRIKSARSDEDEIRIGFPPELRSALIIPVLAEFRTIFPNVAFALTREPSRHMLRSLGLGHIDLCIGLTAEPMEADALGGWAEKVAWVASPLRTDASARPVPVVAHASESALRDIMVSTLRQTEVDYRVVLGGRHIECVIAAATAGLGYTALLESLITPELSVLGEGDGLPPLRDAHWGLYLSGTARSDMNERLATMIAGAIKPAAQAST